jgi:hypothetical protein
MPFMKDCQNDNNIVGTLRLEQVKATMQTGVQVKHVTTRDRVKPTTPLFVKPTTPLLPEQVAWLR